MPGSGAEKRAHADAKRCAKLRHEGLSLRQIAELVGIEKRQVPARIELGERLLSLEAEHAEQRNYLREHERRAEFDSDMRRDAFGDPHG